MRNGASEMFVQCNISSFGELLRNSIFAFRGRIKSSNNKMIHCIVNSVVPLVSNVWKWWRTTLYTGNVSVIFLFACNYQLCYMFVNLCCVWTASLK